MMRRSSSLLPILLPFLAALACVPSTTKVPISVMKAEPTRKFPSTWDDSASAEPRRSAKAQATPRELSPRAGKGARAQSIALVIGIEKYRRNLRDADGAETDARLFAAFAEKTLGLPARNIHLLLGADAT